MLWREIDIVEVEPLAGDAEPNDWEVNAQCFSCDHPSDSIDEKIAI